MVGGLTLTLALHGVLAGFSDEVLEQPEELLLFVKEERRELLLVREAVPGYRVGLGVRLELGLELGLG